MSTQTQIKRALDRSAEVLRRYPQKGQRTYVSYAHIDDGLQCNVIEKNCAFNLDLPPAMGGAGSAPSPTVFLRAAMSSCIAMGIKMWASRQQIPIDSIDVAFEMDVDALGQFGICEDSRPSFEAVRLAIDVVSSGPCDAVESAIETSLKYSPLMDIIQQRGPIARSVKVSQSTNIQEHVQ